MADEEDGLGLEEGLGEMMEEMEAEEFEKSDSFTGMSAAEKKKHRLEYLQLLKQIQAQNGVVEELKDQLIQTCQLPCLTKCELREIKTLRSCMENENLKLQCMVQKAIEMQNELPSRCWEEIPIVTTLEDDVFPKMGNLDVLTVLGLMPDAKDKSDVVCGKKKKPKKPCDPCQAPKPCEDSEQEKLFEEIAQKDKTIRCLNKKLDCLQSQIANISSGQPRRAPPQEDRGVEEAIVCMQSEVSKLKCELKSLCQEKESSGRRPTQESSSKKQHEIDKLKEDYANLLVCYSKKEEQLKNLQGRAKGACGGNAGMSDGVDEAELKMLREKVNDLKDEQEEYTCIIKEQSEQLDNYRTKYLDAQQKVEEQKCMLEKIDMNNKRIEGQIEAEVKRIKTKFKEQLNELSQYPKLLENEQIKLLNSCKEREELENKLRLVCKELKTIRLNTPKPVKPDMEEKLQKCENEFTLLQNQFEELQNEKDLIADELFKAKKDLDTMRAESAKIISSSKERFEMTRSSLCARIDTLEKELAQCRATATLSISDREAVIKEMQGQISTLSYSFDSAQKQIKTLKNHVAFLSNDNCTPPPC